MARRASAPVVLLVVLVSSLALLSGATFYLLQQERTRSITLDEQLREVNQKYTLTQSKIRESERMVGMLESSLKESRNQITKLNAQLEEAVKLKAEALAKVDALQSDLDQQDGIRSTLQKKLDETRVDYDKTMGQLKILETRKTELERKLSKYEPGASPAADPKVDLGVIEVGNASPEPFAPAAQEVPVSLEQAQAAGGPEGQVMVVNADYNFAVINLGSADGIKAGTEFSVFQDKSYIGDLKVEQLHDSMSAAGFLSSAIAGRIREGDLVIPKL